MPQITDALLAAIMPKANNRADKDLVAKLVPELGAQLPPAGIDTRLRIAHFLAQAAEETAGFTRLSENLDYTHAATIARTFPKLAPRAGALVGRPRELADAAYADEWGNGGEASGDGWRYRGRGLFAHTFRSNYAELERALHLPLVAEPDLLEEPKHATAAAVYFFHARGLAAFADRDDIRGVTAKINPALAGLVTRRSYKNACLRFFEGCL